MAKADNENTPSGRMPFNEFMALVEKWISLNELLGRMLVEFRHPDLAKWQTREARRLPA